MKELQYPFDKEYIQSKRRKIKKELLQEPNIRTKKRIAILGGSTTAGVKDMLELFLLNNDIEPVFYESEYNKYFEDGVFSNSDLDEFKPEIVYVFTTVRNITAFPDLEMSLEKIAELVNYEVHKLKTVWDAVHERFGCTVIVNNYELPVYRLLGNLDAVDEHGAVHFVTTINTQLAQEVAGCNYVHLCDLNYLAADYGLRKWHDPIAWYSYKYALNPDAIPDVAFSVANIIKAILGKNKKALVLDLDNTLWGGVIGDDGVDGIALGPEVATGQAYLDFQKYVKELKKLGVLLAIDSKNDEENALAGLRHPDSALREEDFIGIKANWNPKDLNLKELAADLSLGADSFVFVDDNPAERMIVAQNVPGVGVPELDNVVDYISVLDHSGFFEPVTISADDSKRNEMYKQNVQRQNMEASFSDYGEYLRALNMRATIAPFEPVYMARIAQLTNKSNQFNLTTRRYTQEEIEAMADSDEWVTLYGKLEDKFGDNGVVSVAAGRIEGNTCVIDLWLMSCRVLKRDMEYAMMDCFIRQCIKRGVSAIKGVYIPTAKNAMVADFYEKMGYTKVEDTDGVTTWMLYVTEEMPLKNQYIEVEG